MYPEHIESNLINNNSQGVPPLSFLKTQTLDFFDTQPYISVIGDPHMKHTLQSLLMTTVLTLPTAFASDQISPFSYESTTNALATPESNPQVSVTAQFKSMLTKDSFDEVLNATFATELWTKKISKDECTALVALINKHPTFTDDQKHILQGLLPNATSDAICLTASEFSNLGSISPAESAERAKHHERAAALYEKSADYPDAAPSYIQLIADVLSSFGSDYHDRAAALYEKSADHQDVTPFYIRLAADVLSLLGSDYHDRAAVLYEKSADYPAAPSKDIRKAAGGLKTLGSAYHGRADALLSRRLPR